jgi:hypothetical protein
LSPREHDLTSIRNRHLREARLARISDAIAIPIVKHAAGDSGGGRERQRQ